MDRLPNRTKMHNGNVRKRTGRHTRRSRSPHVAEDECMKTRRENRKQFFHSRDARAPLLYCEYQRCIVFGGRRFACEICCVIYRRDERVPCQMCRITITVFIEGRKKIYIISYCSSSRFRLLGHDNANKLRRARARREKQFNNGRALARPPAPFARTHAREPSTTLRLFESLMAFIYAYHFSPNGYDDTHDDTQNTIYVYDECTVSPPHGFFPSKWNGRRRPITHVMKTPVRLYVRRVDKKKENAIKTTLFGLFSGVTRAPGPRTLQETKRSRFRVICPRLLPSLTTSVHRRLSDIFYIFFLECSPFQPPRRFESQKSTHYDD